MNDSESNRKEREESMSQVETILEIKDLCVEFKTVEGTVQAVDHLSYTLHKGEKLGIVGESGSGKSVSSLGMMQLIPNPPGKITGGEILYKGKGNPRIFENSPFLYYCITVLYQNS